MKSHLVAVDVTPMQSEHRLRGVGRYVGCLAEGLARLAPNEVAFLAARSGLTSLPSAIQDRCIVRRRGHRPAQIYWVYNEWFLRRAIGVATADVFHATDFNGLVRVGDTSTIVTLYDCMALKESGPAGLSGWLSDIRWRVYFRHKLGQATHVIAISEQIRGEAISLLGIPADRVTTIPLGVDVKRFSTPRSDRPPLIDRPYLLFLGGGSANKNFWRVLSAFAQIAAAFPDVDLVIAGAWSASDAARLEEQTSRPPLAGRVVRLGFVPDGSLPALYSHAVALALPSLDEGFGLPILEAMAAGTPVLTSDRGAMAEVAGSAALLVEPTLTSSIAEGMLRLLVQHELRADLARRGRQRARLYSWEDTARRTLDVYRTVAEGSPATRRRPTRTPRARGSGRGAAKNAQHTLNGAMTTGGVRSVEG